MNTNVSMGNYNKKETIYQSGKGLNKFFNEIIK